MRNQCASMRIFLDNGLYSEIILFAIGILFSISVACPLFANDPFPMGWYDAIGYYGSSPGEIKNEGGNIVLTYDWSGNPTYVLNYLNAAQANGLKVIVELHRADVAEQDVVAISNFIKNYDSHPAVYGWYTADEPTGSGVTVESCEVAYNTIKQESSKPVFMAFHAGEVKQRAPVAYKNGYDVLLVDDYPLKIGNSVFEGFGDKTTGFLWWEETTPGFKSRIESTNAQAQEIGKPWWLIPQAFGKCPDTTWKWRLPTFREERFMMYWGILNGAEGLLSWCHYRTKQSLALSDQPYPRSGLEWIPEVWEPLAAEMAVLNGALASGVIQGAIGDNKADVECQIFQDPETNEYFLIAVNKASGSETVTFNLNLESEMVTAVSFEGERIDISNGTFSDILTDWDVHVYHLVDVPEPLSWVSFTLCGLTYFCKRPAKIKS